MDVVHSAGSGSLRQPGSPVRPRPRLTDFMRRLGIRAQADAAYARLLRKADEHPDEFWKAVFDYFGIRFSRPYARICDRSFGMPWTVWCVGGETNLVQNCLDRHRDTPVWTQAALIWEAEDGRRRVLTYKALDAEVCKLAAGLSDLGVVPGEVIGLQLPAIPEVVVSLLAALKIGAVVLPLPLDLDNDELIARLSAAEVVAVITADGTRQAGATRTLDEPLRTVAVEVAGLKHLITVRNLGTTATRRTPRDRRWHRVAKRRAVTFPTTPLAADAPALIVHSERAGGPPLATVQTHCGFMAKLLVDFGLCHDWGERDRVLWMADPGTFAGPLQIIATSLLGATLVLAEGSPLARQQARCWRLARDYGATVLVLEAETVRSIMAAGGLGIEDCEFPRLRAVVAAGDGWNADLRRWTAARVCRGRVPLLDYTVCTALGGGVLTGTLCHPQLPEAGSVPVPGCRLDLVDDEGETLPGAGTGTLVLRRPYIAMTRGLWNDPARYLESYWGHGPDLCWLGLDAARGADGSWCLPERDAGEACVVPADGHERAALPAGGGNGRHAGPALSRRSDHEVLPPFVAAHHASTVNSPAIDAEAAARRPEQAP